MIDFDAGMKLETAVGALRRDLHLAAPRIDHGNRGGKLFENVLIGPFGTLQPHPFGAAGFAQCGRH